MAVAYSVDLRWKIVRACERGTESQREVAQFFGVSLSFAESLLSLYRETSDVIARSAHCRRGPKAHVDATGRERIRQWVEEQSDLTLEELVDRLAASTDIKVSVPTMSRVLNQLGLPRKKRPFMPQSETRLR
jgi:transposase